MSEEEEKEVEVAEEVQAEEAAAPEVAEEAPKAEKKVGPKPLDEKKVEKDESNMAHFSEGDEVEVKGLPMVVKEVRGVELVLKRKDLV